MTIHPAKVPDTVPFLEETPHPGKAPATFGSPKKIRISVKWLDTEKRICKMRDGSIM
jgi:hypothetical protein